MPLPNATIIGSGPNGLSAAIVLAQAGLSVTVFERNPQIGGACSSAETTLPGFRQDLGSSAYPLGVASPFFRSLPSPLPWIEPSAPCAHPFDDGTAVMLEHSIVNTADTLDECDRDRYRSLIEPLELNFPELCEDVLGPIQHVPRHPLILAKFGAVALRSAATFAQSQFRGKRARAFFAGMATHSVLSLTAPASTAVALFLLASGHSTGWPILLGGAQALPEVLAGYLEELGGSTKVNHEVCELPDSDLVLAAVTPRQLLQIAGKQLPMDYRSRLERFRYGAGAFKIDYALNAPIPWAAPECSRAATVHVGGSFEEIVDSEMTFNSNRPFVLLGQPSLFDSSRAPAGCHTAWAYCHVPNGSTRDWMDPIESQISRFAPGFRDCVISRSVSSPAALEEWNPNLIGGDFLGGAMDIRQLLFRPTPSLYRTPLRNLFLCGASTPPGGGVHGMCGYHAATTALAHLDRR